MIEEMRKGIDKVGGDNRVGKPVRGATGDATGQAGAGPHQAWRGGPSVAAGAGRRADAWVGAKGVATDVIVGPTACLDDISSNLATLKRIFGLDGEAERNESVHRQMAERAAECAARIGQVLEAAIASGRLAEADVFDRDYRPIPGTRPQKYHTRYDAYTDEVFPAVQEAVIDAYDGVVYAGAVDVNGYFPTHNRRYAQAPTGNHDKDLLIHRTKRIFDDPVGRRCGANESPILLQTYRRDTGELMHDVSAPIRVGGRHWGGFRIGYRA
ncbi:MAG: hypothetical protein H6945_16455 [Zoogloeaceae bacterium]|nr:hypothetical protein [Rhodocyclaceae bacterium]MCP5237330.1 hypothetical protein [Zoogloeaceae bacterium]